MEKRTVVVLHLDGQPDAQGECFTVDGVEFPKEVPVTFNFDRTLKGYAGVAKLRLEGTILYADLEVLPQAIEMAQVAFPCVGGVTLAREPLGEGKTLLRSEVREIGLCQGPNSDLRIQRVGEQVATQGMQATIDTLTAAATAREAARDKSKHHPECGGDGYLRDGPWGNGTPCPDCESGEFKR